MALFFEVSQSCTLIDDHFFLTLFLVFFRNILAFKYSLNLFLALFAERVDQI